MYPAPLRDPTTDATFEAFDIFCLVFFKFIDRIMWSRLLKVQTNTFINLFIANLRFSCHRLQNTPKSAGTYVISQSMGVRRKFSRRVQRRHFAYPFQVADDAMQMDVHEMIYTFYTTKNAPYYGSSHTNSLRCSNSQVYYDNLFSHIFKAGHFFSKKHCQGFPRKKHCRGP